MPKMNTSFSIFLVPIILLLLVHQYNLVLSLTVRNIINTDKEALIAIKESIKTDSASRLLKGNWSGNNVCEWIGIICSSRYNRVSELDISRMGVQGEIARQIGNLSFLISIDMSFNYFSGNLPQEMDRLRRLKFLNLENNNITGEIPVGLFNISSIRLFGMDSNQLTGTLPIIRLPNLEQLVLSFNYLEGSIPPSISNSSKLEILALDHNYFSGAIPNSIGSLSYLQRFRLHDNNLTNDYTELGIITTLTNCRALFEIILNYNPLGGTLPPSIGNLSSTLDTLDIRGAKLKGNIPNEIGNLTSLTKLALSQNEFSGTIPSTIQDLQQLQGITLKFNKLSGLFPVALCKLPNLFILYLEFNEFSGPLPECVGDMASLGEFYIHNNMFSGILPESLWSLKYLLQLNIRNNNFNGTLSPNMGSMKGLNALALSGNQFTGNIPREIGELVNLAYLSFAGNRLDGSIPEIGELVNLAYVSFAGNRLEGSIPEIFGNITHLEFLNLSANNLSGVIPKSLESVDSLKYFNVSFNKLEGEIPSGGPFHNFTKGSFMSNDGFCGGAPPLEFPPCPSNSLLKPDKPSSRNKTKLFVFICIPLALGAVLLLIVIYVWMKKFRNRLPKTQPQPSVDPNFMRISYFELEQATNGFSESNLLGKGSFGSVYKATLTSGDIYAVKVFHMQHEGAYKSFDQECEVLRNIRHKNLVKVISSCVNLDFKSLVLQYMPNGSLENWLYGENYHLGFLERLNVMVDVAYALEHLHFGHSTPVIHCDLKPSNVLLDIKMAGYVADFGMSKLLVDEESFIHTNTLATFGYMAPEYGMEGTVSTMCDVYSFGIMLMEVFTRKRPSNEMFNEDLTLRSWVVNAAKDNLIAIIDADILDEDEAQLKKKLESVSSIIELALNCSKEYPQARLNMIETVATLKRIKASFLKLDN